jgi:hypothetical protein
MKFLGKMIGKSLCVLVKAKIFRYKTKKKGKYHKFNFIKVINYLASKIHSIIVKDKAQTRRVLYEVTCDKRLVSTYIKTL